MKYEYDLLTMVDVRRGISTIKIYNKMKKTILSLFAVGIIAVISNDVKAQTSAIANATATIVAPITITFVDDLEFGNVAVQAGTAGTVVMAPAGTRSRTAGVTLPATTGTFNAADFTVGGSGTYTYAITLPAAALTITDGTNTMTVDNWTSTPSGTGALTGGTQTLKVGATLNVAGGQIPGTYQHATGFTVTVNYN